MQTCRLCCSASHSRSALGLLLVPLTVMVTLSASAVVMLEEAGVIVTVGFVAAGFGILKMSVAEVRERQNSGDAWSTRR